MGTTAKTYAPVAGRILIAPLFHFMKNLAILEGLLYVMAAGSGPLSLKK